MGKKYELKYDYQELYLIARLFLICIDKTQFIGYNINGDKRRLIVWKLNVSVKAVDPTVSGSFKSSRPYR